jgi:hypothetical protein
MPWTQQLTYVMQVTRNYQAQHDVGQQDRTATHQRQRALTRAEPRTGGRE